MVGYLVKVVREDSTGEVAFANFHFEESIANSEAEYISRYPDITSVNINKCNFEIISKKVIK